ncbi:hypothetical protein DAERI_020218 [Deinococcus aerius]|uniref:Uncharacterized protein n=2 Tax=Deinococcus TaxID=1298 RepID=A0A2I9DIP6_9DEIO|nr:MULTISPECIES: hypothetical protein [Deinococcus]MBB5293920.1 hypothetical protein [Deinococcus metallilatus]QBY07141.1 hypothetical protein E5F05_03930 [Deinococcus metallilatus]RXJ14613.1 hypothetical protein ERJ73_02660 [Deinococcus metallilatus]TLK30733.1 hypothetical protein FCS05_02975 [Deinococcus metallilatus]GBF04621.1 hypothetical protein DAERI_020218 [Deinococcus aerius]
MRGKLLLLFTAAVLGASPTGEAAAFRFANLAWGADRSEAHPILTRQGWRFERQAAHGDAVYSGTLQGYRARAILKYDPLGRLVAVDVRVLPAEADLLGAYGALRAAVILRQGDPAYSLSSFRLPYREGDGRELEALKRHHAVFDTVWYDPHELNLEARSGMQMEVVTTPFSRLEIRQFYLSNGWTEEYGRRAGLLERGT